MEHIDLDDWFGRWLVPIVLCSILPGLSTSYGYDLAISLGIAALSIIIMLMALVVIISVNNFLVKKLERWS